MLSNVSQLGKLVLWGCDSKYRTNQKEFYRDLDIFENKFDTERSCGGITAETSHFDISLSTTERDQGKFLLLQK